MGLSSGLYAAYGSNMDPEQMLERCPHSPAAGTGWLSGWRLSFGGEDLGWDGSLPMVVPDPGGQVFVALYDVSPPDMRTLDYWEGADTGLYNKDPAAGLDPRRGRPGLGLHPGRLRGRTALGPLHRSHRRRRPAAGAPDEYVAELRSRPCRSLGE